MSWLITLVLAGVVFTPEMNLPIQTNYNYTNTAAAKTVSPDETERFEQTYPISATGRISVSNVNGSITIETWERNEVKIEAFKNAADKERLSDVEIKINAQKDSLTIETNYEKQESTWSRKNYKYLSVEYRLTVPRNAVLDEIETVNGAINITNSNNLTKASAVNGNVTANNLRGTANLSTVNGTVEANFDQLQSTSRINLDTVNGTVNLTIPSDANATVKADTVNGKIVNDFGLPVHKGQYVGKDLYGKIGSGEVQIKLNSVNGGLNIKRRNDGKSVNPIINLLPQKSREDDEENWDSDDNSSLDADKMNSDINKALKDSQKERDAALKNSQKEMEAARKEMDKIRPELAKLNQQEIQAKIDESMKLQRETMARLAEVNFSAVPFIEKKSETFTVEGRPKVIVDGGVCEIKVHSWDKSEVRYDFTRVMKSQRNEPALVEVRAKDSEINISVSETKSGLQMLRLEIWVPRKTDLRIKSLNQIRVENVSGEISVESMDEAIEIRDCEGKLKAINMDGKIRVIGFKGEITSQTLDGDMSLEGDFQKFSATTEDGNIIVTLPDDASAIIRANTESVNLEGIAPSRITTADVSETSSLWRIGNGGAEYNFKVSDGRIYIRSAGDLQSKP